MKTFRKFLFTFLVVAMVLQMCSIALAAPQGKDGVEILDGVYLLDSSSSSSVVKEVTDFGYIISRYDRITNKEIIEIYDRTGKQLSREILDFNAITTGPVTTAVTEYQHTFSNREYEIDATKSPPYWTCLKVGLRKDRMQTSGSMEAALFRFKGAVDTLNEEELELVGMIGASLVTDVIGALNTGGIGAAVALVWDQIFAADQIAVINDAINEADEAFDAIP